MLTSCVCPWLNEKARDLYPFRGKVQRKGRTERHVKRECSRLEGTKYSGDHKEN